MGRLLRIVFIVLCFLGIAFLAGLEYVNRIGLPLKIKPWVESSLSEMLGRRVSVSHIRVHPWHGVMIQEVAVEEDARYGKEPFLQIERISGGILYLPLFKERRLVIPVLRIVRPRCRILQDANGIWNIQSLIFAPPAKRARPSRFQMVIPRVVLTDGAFTLHLHRSDSLLKFHFEPLDARMGLSLPSSIQGDITTQLATTPPTQLRLEGNVDLRSHVFHLKTKSHLPLATLASYFPSKGNPAPFSLEGLATCDLELSGEPLGPYAFKGSLQTKGLQWKTPLGQEHAPLQGAGDFRLGLHGELPTLDAAGFLKSISGTLDLGSMSVQPVPGIGELRDLSGQFTLNPEGIRTERLTALLPSGQQVTLSGALTNDSKKSFTLKANAQLSLDQLPLPLEPQVITQAMKPSGQVILEAQAEGVLQPILSWQPSVTATLQNVSLDLAPAGPLREGSGVIHLRQDVVTLTDLKGSFRDQSFQAEGSLVNFNQPEIDARLNWGPLDAEVRLTLDGNRAEIHTLSGRYQNLSFRIFGEISDWKKEASGNLYGETAFPCEELAQILPNPPAWVKGLPLQGEVQTRWLLQGPLSKPSAWDLDLKANSSKLNLKKIPFTQVALQSTLKEGQLILETLKASFSGGTVGLKGQLLAHDPKASWRGTLTLQDLELAELAQHLNWKTQELSGLLFLESQCTGKGANLAALQGRGKVHVEGGRIVEFPLLGRFAEFLKLPTLRTIAFEKADGSFTLQEGFLRTEALQLTAQKAALSIAGKGGYLQGLDSPIEWRILPTLSSEIIPEESRSKIGKVIAQGASYLVGEIRITGTWKNPKQTFVPKPITQILNEQLFNLQETLKDLF